MVINPLSKGVQRGDLRRASESEAKTESMGRFKIKKKGKKRKTSFFGKRMKKKQGVSKSTKKTALITGITGFAGSHLAELLLSENVDVHGIQRWRSKSDNIEKIKEKTGDSV